MLRSASLRPLHTRYVIWLRLLRWHQGLSFHGVQVRRFQASKNPGEGLGFADKSKELREAMVKDHLQGDYVVVMSVEKLQSS